MGWFNKSHPREIEHPLGLTERRQENLFEHDKCSEKCTNWNESRINLHLFKKLGAIEKFDRIETYEIRRDQ